MFTNIQLHDGNRCIGKTNPSKKPQENCTAKTFYNYFLLRKSVDSNSEPYYGVKVSISNGLYPGRGSRKIGYMWGILVR